MSKLFKITFILSAFIATTCQASSDGLYTGVQLGGAGLVFAGTGVYGRLLLGDQINRFFALETGVTLVPHTYGSDWLDVDAGQAYTVDGDVKLMLPLGSRFNLYAKAGPSVAYIGADGNNMVKLSANAALGMNLDLTKHVSTDLSVGTLFVPPHLTTRSFLGFIGLGVNYHFA